MSSNTEVTKYEDAYAVAKTTVAKGLTDAEFQLYVHDCARQSVHPLDRLIHPTVRTSKDGTRRYTPIASIDLFRARAEATGEYAGNDDPVFDNEEKPQKATVTVYRLVQGQRVGFTASARWSQYFPGEKDGFMWAKMPHLMLGKCAEALALRKAFPRQLHGLYAKEEMEQAGEVSGNGDKPPAESIPIPKALPAKTTDGGQVTKPKDGWIIGPFGQEPKDVPPEVQKAAEILGGTVESVRALPEEGITITKVTDKEGKKPALVETSDGQVYSTYSDTIIETAKSLQGELVKITSHTQQKGKYVNVLLDSVEPLAIDTTVPTDDQPF